MTTRRDFLRSAAAVVAGAPLLDSPFGPPRNKPLGWALVGLGSLSTNQLAPALQKTTNCRLAGIVTGTPAKAERWKTRYGIPDRSIYNYENMESMADNPDIDVVYVVTPNALHAEHTIKAARAGKHVFCEKPMEISVERCEAMIAACKKAGRRLAIGYRCQYEPLHLECVRLAKEKEFGALTRIEASFGFTIGNPTQWRLNRALAGGGPLMDVGVYTVQTARMLTGQEPLRATARTSLTNPTKFKEVEETMEFELHFPGDVVMRSTTSYNANSNRFTAFAQRGSFGMEPAYNYAGHRGSRSDGKDMRFEPVDAFALEMDDFAQCITTGARSRVSGEEGLKDMKILSALYESARTSGAAVRIS